MDRLNVDGFLVIDKPEGITSHQVVQIVRQELNIKKAGHLGTLDPMATGVLPLALGGATRLVKFLMGGVKVYRGTITLGFSTDTYDRLGQPSSAFLKPSFSQRQFDQVIDSMKGNQLQSPPPFSAKKIAGQRSYKLARKGLKVELPPQKVSVYKFRTWTKKPETIEFEIHCSPGTYIRSIAHELGEKLGCGGHLSRLQRTVSGKFYLKMAFKLDCLTKLKNWKNYLLPINSMLRDIPEVCISKQLEEFFLHGRSLEILASSLSQSPSILIRVLSDSGDFLGLAEKGTPIRSVDNQKKLIIPLLPKIVL
tara:strand:+ start:140 stop:1063 length:924 start_codon:yes stop_codon:yes gene_type:complete